MRSRSASIHARSTYQGCGWAMATSGARAAAAAISRSGIAVRATRSAMPMPKAASRTSSPTRAAPGAQVFQARLHVVTLAIAPGAGVHHHAAADGDHRREHADDETIAGQQERRLPQDEAHVCGDRKST